MNNSVNAIQLREKERIGEINQVIKLISHNLAMPLYVLFWLCDLIYLPAYKWEFLTLRVLIIPFCFLIRFLIKKSKNVLHAQLLSVFFITILALLINVMIFFSLDSASPYYAGLNLVALGTLSFIPWSRGFYVLTTIAIYSPYWFFGIVSYLKNGSWNGFLVNQFFIVGTITISYVMRFYNESLRKKELASRIALENELNNRDNIIKKKTEEAVNLSTLSSQFSPQIVEAIRLGHIDLEKGIIRSEICAIFIDIVSSTERIARLDKDKVNKVIAKFIDDVIPTLLKYDITIDKFLGDGVLAFSNNPVNYDDYVKRVIMAAFEINRKIRDNKDFYIHNWLNELQIRIGISAGFANVGFYGSKKFFRSYTAIGSVINMASRLCSMAGPNKIIADYEVVQRLKNSEFIFKDLGTKTIKGFEKDLIHIFEIEETENESKNLDIPECLDCGNIMHLTSNNKGLFVFKCRNCGKTYDSAEQVNVKKAA